MRMEMEGVRAEKEENAWVEEEPGVVPPELARLLDGGHGRALGHEGR